MSNNTLMQAGSCVTSVQERFDSAVILYISNSSDGWVQRNKFHWKCGWLNMDVSERGAIVHTFCSALLTLFAVVLL